MSQPEAELVGEVGAGSTSTVALDERNGGEAFKA